MIFISFMYNLTKTIMDKLEQALAQGYRFEMGKYMSDGWDY